MTRPEVIHIKWVSRDNICVSTYFLFLSLIEYGKSNSVGETRYIWYNSVLENIEQSINFEAHTDIALRKPAEE